MFEKILKWYKQGLWTDTMVHMAVMKGAITENEATIILESKQQ